MPTTNELRELASDINSNNNAYQDMIDAHKIHEDSIPESNSWYDSEGDNPNPHDAQITAEVQKFKLLNTSFDTTSTDPVSQLEELMDFQKASFIQVANGVSGLTNSTPGESLTDIFNKAIIEMEEKNVIDRTLFNGENCV